jgi:transketolase
MTMDFRDSVFNTIRDLMQEDPAFIVLTNDMGAMILDQIKEAEPDRVINVGIAEQNLMSVAGGLALAGRRVFCFGIAAHIATRCWEQLKLDVCAPALPVVLIGAGPGLSYGNDGPTHHATEDLALMRTLPNMAIFNPSDAVNTAQCVRLASQHKGPAYLRLDRESIVPRHDPASDGAKGFRIFRDGGDVTLLSTGVILGSVLKAAELLAADGLSVRVADVFRLKPLSGEDLAEIIGHPRRVVTVEEHNITGGFGAAVAMHLATRDNSPPLTVLGLPDSFLFGSASRGWAHQEFGLTAEGIAASVRAAMTRGTP